MKDKRSKFYLLMSYLISGIALVGFGPPFIPRPFVKQPESQPPSSAWGIFHSIIGFLWIIIFILRTTLIQANRVRLHMRLGWAFVVLAIMLCVSIVIAALNRPFRLLDAGWTREPLGDGGLNLATVGFLDIGGAIYFGSLFIMGLLARKSPDRHPAFMLYAGITVVFQAFVRIGEIFFVDERGLITGAIIALTVILLPLIYETFNYRMPQKLTVGIFLFLIIAQIGFQVIGCLPGIIDFTGVW